LTPANPPNNTSIGEPIAKAQSDQAGFHRKFIQPADLEGFTSDFSDFSQPEYLPDFFRLTSPPIAPKLEKSTSPLRNTPTRNMPTLSFGTITPRLPRSTDRSTARSITRRIQTLIDRHLRLAQLDACLADLPQQFQQPVIRRWRPIDWQAIQPSQIVGMSVTTFSAILVGAIDTEAPIRAYTQTSRQYLAALHPDLAKFVGGTLDANGVVIEIGLWEKEERRHTPILRRVYQQLTGASIQPDDRQVRPYQPTDDAVTDLFRHGLHRIATEYGATCLYLWLMAHSTGALHQVFEELMLDEMNHMTKYWGFGVWAYPESNLGTVITTLSKTSKLKIRYNKSNSSLIGTLNRMTQVLAWDTWSWSNRLSFMWTSVQVLRQLLKWHRSLTRSDLDNLFGVPNLTQSS
jgi:hypothetical protein